MIKIFALFFATASVLAISVSAQPRTRKPTIVDIKTKLLFDVAVVRNQRTPFLVFYFSSTECPTCKSTQLPLIEKLVNGKGGSLNLAMIDFDKVPEFKVDHAVDKIPTVMTFFKGDVTDVVEDSKYLDIVGMANRAVMLTESAKP